MVKFLARCYLKLTGWKAEGEKPTAPRFVLIAAPHTSNWDFVYLLAFSVIFDMKISWMGKHILFRPPMGWFMRRLGGIPIVRHRSGQLVSQMARSFEESKARILVVPAEGTRRYVAHWKSGFYHIARMAKVPIVMGYLDYTRRRGGFGAALDVTEDLRRDMDEIRHFYSDKMGKYPEKFGAIRLKEEM